METEVEEGMGEFKLANAADTLVKLGELFNIPIPNGAADLIDASSFDTVKFKDYIAARLRDGEEADIEMNWVPGSETDDLCIEARDKKRRFEINIPQGTGTYKFAGTVLVRDYVRVNPMGDKRTGSLKVKWVSEITETWTPGHLMSLDPEGVVKFDAVGETYRLFFGMRAMKEIERHYDKPFMKAIQAAMPQLGVEDLADKAKLFEASANIRLGDVATLFGFGLVKHHPDMAEDDLDELIDGIGVVRASELLGEALAASIGAGEGDGEATANPPTRKRPSRTG